MAKTDISQFHKGAGYYELPDGSRVRGKAKAQAALDALQTEGPNPDLKTTTKKGTDEMTDAHRRHIERWEPVVDALGIDHVWAATPRAPGRGDGPFFLAVKFESKRYGIVALDTTDLSQEPEVLVDNVTSPKVILQEFRAFRSQAKAERDKLRSEAKAKPEAKAKTSKKTVAKKKAKAS